jgi:hypothetical protein
MHIRPLINQRPGARAGHGSSKAACHEPPRHPRPSRLPPPPDHAVDWHAQNRTTAGGTVTRSRLMRSNSPSNGLHPVRTPASAILDRLGHSVFFKSENLSAQSGVHPPFKSSGCVYYCSICPSRTSERGGKGDCVKEGGVCVFITEGSVLGRDNSCD